MRKEKVFIKSVLLVIFIIFMITYVNASVADAYYEEAKKAYEAGNCVNASEHAHRALELYIKDNNQGGISKTTELIKKINTCLKNNGDVYYTQALNFYNSRTLEGYNNAITWAEKAEEQYHHIPDPIGENKSIDLIQLAEERIKEIKIEQADEIYKKARELYEKDDLIAAKDEANKALEIYTGINYDVGISKCDALLLAIDKRIYDLTREADTNYRYAQEHYKTALYTKSFYDYNKAKEYAEKAKDIYSIVGNTEGYDNSRQLIDLINSEIGRLEENFNKIASNYYDNASTEFLYAQVAMEKEEQRKHYHTADPNVREAKTIYYQLYEWAKSIKDPKESEKKKKLYWSLMSKCDDLLNKITKKLDEIDKAERAESLYIEATALLNEGLCENASKLANEAKSIFNEIGDFLGVGKCDTLIYQINKCLEALEKAQSLYENATTYCNIADYGNASLFLEEAVAIYKNIKNQDGIKKCDSFRENITKMSEKKEKANLLIDKAEMYFHQNRFEDSIRAAEEAKEIYEKLNYTEGISNAISLIESNEKMIDKIGRGAREKTMITILVILLTIVIIVVIWWVNKTQKIQADKRTMEEESKGLEEKLEHEREEKRRMGEMERKRLKAMVGEEMKRLEKEKIE